MGTVDRMAGLGEDIAAIPKANVQARKSLSCTSMPCSWLPHARTFWTSFITVDTVSHNIYHNSHEGVEGDCVCSVMGNGDGYGVLCMCV